MNFSLRHLRYFLASAEKGQVSLAAASLSVSQSTVTTALQQLERELGVVLFRRLPGGVELTLEGARFLPHARNVLEAVSLAERARLSEPADLSGVVRLGVTPTAAGYWLARPMKRFARAFPEVRLVLSELTRPEIEPALGRDLVDLAILPAPEKTGDGALAWEPLLRSRRRLWISPDHPQLPAGAADLADIAQMPYVAVSADEESRAAARYWRQIGRSPQVQFVTSSVEAARSLVAEGLGVTILPDLLYRPYSLEGQRIETRPLASAAPALELGFGWRSERKPEPVAQTLMDFLSRTAGGGVA